MANSLGICTQQKCLLKPLIGHRPHLQDVHESFTKKVCSFICRAKSVVYTVPDDNNGADYHWYISNLPIDNRY